MVWPLLLAVVVLALQSPHPPRILASFLAGGLLTTVTVGVLLVHVMQGSSLANRPGREPAAAIPIAIGVVALSTAVALMRRRNAPSAPQAVASAQPAKPARLQRALDRGAPIAFLGAIALNIVPGPFPVVAMKDIAELGYGTPGTIAVVLCFYLVMFVPLEVPLVAFFVSPTRTAVATVGANAWLGRNGRRIAIYALGVGGVYLIARGLTLLS
jgi:hypothetical protein